MDNLTNNSNIHAMYEQYMGSIWIVCRQDMRYYTRQYANNVQATYDSLWAIYGII
jgi:hypothetical protein